MKITKQTTIELTPADVKKIIVEHLKTNGYNIKDVHFIVGGHNDPGDIFAERPLTYSLDKIVCKESEE